MISEQFCFHLIKDSKTYLNFVNIVIIEYIDFISELKNCYEGAPDKFVVDQLLNKYKRRIPLYKTCFQNIGDSLTPEFIKKCWFICQSFKFNKISPVFDGDLELVKLILIELMSF